jgi:hypothetical protein
MGAEAPPDLQVPGQDGRGNPGSASQGIRKDLEVEVGRPAPVLARVTDRRERLASVSDVPGDDPIHRLQGQVTIDGAEDHLLVLEGHPVLQDHTRTVLRDAVFLPGPNDHPVQGRVNGGAGRNEQVQAQVGRPVQGPVVSRHLECL